MIEVDNALRKVGISLVDLRRQAGSIIDSGESFLVGSLAQGFGNRGSDVDIHHFTPGAEKSAPPYLFFVGQVPVDIEYMPHRYAQTIVSDLGKDRVQDRAGTFALHEPPDSRNQNLLTRWLTALPFEVSSPAVLSDAEIELVLAHLLRAALDQALLSVVLAQLVDSAGHHTEFLWWQVQQAILNLVCAARNQPPAGTKWLSARVEKVVTPRELRRVRGVCSAQSLATVRDLLPDVDAYLSVRVVEDVELKPRPIGRTKFWLTRRGRLEPEQKLLTGTVGEMARGHEREVVEQLRSGLVQLVTDEQTISAELRRAC